ncbi:MAG TPA: ABC transporter permease subunit [bacterium]|nr:ABC transporter permease subunit [bacterium]HPN33364.1 ABC transporter permease subunit [bacterium]
MNSPLFELRGVLAKSTKIKIGLIGLAAILIIWWLAVKLRIVNPQIIPSPFSILASFPELISRDRMFHHLGLTVFMNIAGWIEGALISLPIGFIIGLFPVFNALFGGYIQATRYIPLTATIVLFMAAFGIYMMMKIQFLTFAILVYLITAVVGRIQETPQVYVDAVKTLGASKWQIIRTVFIPHVLSRVSTDFINIVAFSWTYAVYVELINKQEGGIGALIYNLYFRQNQTEKLYALIILMVGVGYAFDLLLRMLDRKAFPFKYS